MAQRRSRQRAESACNLGRVRLELGDVKGAISYFERALELDPRNPRFYWNLVHGRGGSVEDRHVVAMERLREASADLSTGERIDLHFALAGVYERRGRFEDAFRELVAGNGLKRSTLDYDGTAPRFIDALREFFSAALIESLRGCGNGSERPIFVFGMPRSGTTLVEQLLAVQPGLTAGGELPVLGSLADELWKTLRGGLLLPEFRARIRTLGDDYVRATDASSAGAARHTDKTPDNFRYAPLINLVLPNAKMIHVRRDRLDTCLSCYTTLFARNFVPYAYDLGDLARYYAAYERAMASWRALLPGDRFLEVDYEVLVDDFEVEARRILDFCGLPWTAATLSFHEFRRPIRTASNVQVRRPLYRSAVGRSRHFAAYLEPLLDSQAPVPG